MIKSAVKSSNAKPRKTAFANELKFRNSDSPHIIENTIISISNNICCRSTLFFLRVCGPYQFLYILYDKRHYSS